MTTNIPAANFGEIGALMEAFAEAKKIRRARCPAHVLVVEDDPLTCRLVAGALASTHAVITEENAKNAVGSYLLHAPDIVFLDIGLPDMDGFMVLDQIITIDPDAFVVMFSSHDNWENVTRALAAGAKGFLSKPFKKEALKNYIQNSATHHHKSCE